MSQTPFDVPLSELRERRSYKWRAHPPDVLPAFVAEMDCQLAPPVAEAVVDAVVAGDVGYAWPQPELAEALSSFLLARYGWEVDPAGVALIPDIMAGAAELLRMSVGPGTGVVVNTPVYEPFFTHIAEAGCRLVEAPLAQGPDGYRLDLDAVERAFASGARAYLLCNPHNPTGRSFARPELERIAELAARYDVLVLSDEIHAPLVLPGAVHTPFPSVSEAAADRGIALVSASKAWNVAGLKCAQAVAASDAMRSLVAGFSLDVILRAGSAGIIASTAAYRDGCAWLDELLPALDRNRRLLVDLLAEWLPAVRYRPPEAGFLAWLDCRPLGLDEEPATVFLERGRVALGPGPSFGTGGAGHVRITMATSEAILTEIVERMCAALS
jgi:cystathionine beta-lyase